MPRALWIVLLLACLTGCSHIQPAGRKPAASPDYDFPILKSIINDNVTTGSPKL